MTARRGEDIAKSNQYADIKYGIVSVSTKTLCQDALIFLAHHFPSPTEASSAARTQTRHDINTFLSHVMYTYH
jgi:hypothetical protein